MSADRAARRRALTLSVVVVAAVVAGVLPGTGTVSAASPGGMAGSGTVGDPYVVTDATQLQAISQDLSANYVLGSDVDASATAGWNSDAGFAPLGDSSTPFSGSFDGAGYTISNLTITRPSTNYVGLFGATDSGATVSNVTLTGTIEGQSVVGGLVGYSPGSVANSTTNVTLTASDYSGGLVGMNHGPVSNSSVAGTVTAEMYVGGLIGFNDGLVSNSSASGDVVGTGLGYYVGGLLGFNNDQTVSRSTASGPVTGDTYVGGLVGSNEGTVSNASATGAVTGDDSVGGLVGLNKIADISTSFASGAVSGTSNVGGLVGSNKYATVTDSYWNTETTGQATSAGGTGLTTAQMTGLDANDSMSGFAFYDAWVLTSSYPVLTAQYFDNLAGDGTDANPYVLTDVTELQAVAVDLSTNYTLGNDIDASVTSEWHNGAGFIPLGGSVTKFTGSFDGAGYTVSNLTIDRPTQSAVGLFGMTGLAPITDVHLANVSVDGDTSVGGLVGVNFAQSNVSGASVSGTVTGNDSVGGLVGYNYYNSLVAESTADVTVTGNNSVGGLVGYNNDDSVVYRATASGDVVGSGTNVGGLVGQNAARSVVSNATARGDVTSLGDTVGGLVGLLTNEAEVLDSRASGAVDGDARVGGLVGHANESATVSTSFATGAVTGPATVGGLVGDTATGAVVADSYWDTETTGQATSAGGTGLTTAQMTGTAAATTMSALDFTTVWTATGLYPRFQRTFAPPTVTDLTVTNPAGTDVAVGVTSDQRLATLSVSITGTASTTLSLGDVTETDNGDGTYTYSGTYSAATSGTYTATVDVAANGDGDDDVSSPFDSVVVDRVSPTADAGADQTVRVGTPVQFDGSASTDNLGVVGYEWSFGDGTPMETGVTTTHTYDTPGSYLVVLTVTDPADTTGADTMTVTVQAADDRGPAVTGMRAPAGGSLTTRGRSVTVDFGTGDNWVVQSASVRFGTRAGELLAFDRFDEHPTDTAATGGTFITAVAITVSDDAAKTPSTLQFELDRATLDARGAAPGRLQVEHYDDELDEWAPLSTTVVDADGARVVLRAETPGFSMFAVTVRPPSPASSSPATTRPAETDPKPTAQPSAASSTAVETTTAPPTTATTTPGFGAGAAGGAVFVVIVVTVIAAHRRRWSGR